MNLKKLLTLGAVTLLASVIAGAADSAHPQLKAPEKITPVQQSADPIPPSDVPVTSTTQPASGGTDQTASQTGSTSTTTTTQVQATATSDGSATVPSISTTAQ